MSTSSLKGMGEATSPSSPARGQREPFKVYNMPGEEDYFLNHPNTVLLGFLGAVAVILLALILIVWIGDQIF